MMEILKRVFISTTQAMIESIIYAIKTRRAWWFTASSRTSERFARTTLGSFWLGLSNLLSVGALAFVYGTVFKVDNFKEYAVYLGIGLVTWNSIAGAIQAAPNILKNNSSNIKNTNINPIFYTLEEWSFQVQTFGQSFAMVIIALSILNHSLIINLLTAGLLPLINLLIFIYWLPLLICLLGAKYEDLFQLIPIVMQLMFLLSPILYKKEALGAISWTAEMNPVFKVLNHFRLSVINGTLSPLESVATLLLNLIAVYLSVRLLERKKSQLPFLV